MAVTVHMNHRSWIEFVCSKWPHVVHVDENTSDYRARGDWLEAHVGPRNGVWNYPEVGVYVFLHEHDALLFSLVWS